MIRYRAPMNSSAATMTAISPSERTMSANDFFMAGSR